MAERYVVVGLARSRCRWFGELARWATAAVAPIEFVKCLTAEEARAVIGAGRPVSALLVDGGLPRFDRDLVDAAGRAGAPTILVGPFADRDWEGLGCAAVLEEDFGRDQLVEALDRFARQVARSASPATTRVDLVGPPDLGLLVGVTGAGGTGASTVAMAVAQALAASGSDTVLVDGCRRADLAMYHDVGDVIPGMPEVVELHRGDEPDPAQIRELEFDVPARGYRLVLGQRRPRDWAGARPGAVGAAIDGLRRTHEAVVVDHDADLDREEDTGSVDVEERHAIALATAERADVVVVVAGPGVKGLHAGARVVDDLYAVGVPPERILPVLSAAPRSPALRSQWSRALAALTSERSAAAGRIPSPVFVRHVRSMESLHRIVTRLPRPLTDPLGRAVLRVAGGGRPVGDGAPVTVRPGDLGAATVLGLSTAAPT
jgi:hypothetical protein